MSSCEDARSRLRLEDVTGKIIAGAIEVHRYLGPGLLESTYEGCLSRELELRELPFAAQVPVGLKYKGLTIECGYRIDLVVDRAVVVELKSVEKHLPIHEAQVLTYMRLAKLRIGLLISFNVKVLKEGIKRFVF